MSDHCECEDCPACWDNIVTDRDEWKQQHENLLAIYRTTLEDKARLREALETAQEDICRDSCPTKHSAHRAVCILLTDTLNPKSPTPAPVEKKCVACGEYHGIAPCDPAASDLVLRNPKTGELMEFNEVKFDPTWKPPTPVEATHRCKICGALWRLNPPEFPNHCGPKGCEWCRFGSWSVKTPREQWRVYPGHAQGQPHPCGPCCDNVTMGKQIEPLPRATPHEEAKSGCGSCGASTVEPHAMDCAALHGLYSAPPVVGERTRIVTGCMKHPNGYAEDCDVCVDRAPVVGEEVKRATPGVPCCNGIVLDGRHSSYCSAPTTSKGDEE